MRPTKTIFIAAIPRCGSTRLSSLMHATHSLGYPLEYINSDTTQFFRPGTEPTIENQCLHAEGEGITPNGVLSIKFMPYQYRALEQEIDVERRFGKPSWIWLRRGDILAQAVSLSRAMQTGQWAMGGDDTPALAKYSFDDIKQRIEEIQYEEDFWCDLFARHEIEPLCVWYDDVTNDADNLIARIFQFVGEKKANAVSRSMQSVRRPDYFKDARIQRDEKNAFWMRQFLAEAIERRPHRMVAAES